MGRRKRHKSKTFVHDDEIKKIFPASSPEGQDVIQDVVKEMQSKGEIPDDRLEDDERNTILLRVTPVCWAFPFDEVVFAKWTKHMLGACRLMPWDDIILTESTYLPEARNDLHTDFLDYSKCEWLQLLDTDVIAPPGFEGKLLEHCQNNPDVRMVGGWYRKKGEPYGPVVYKHGPVLDDDGIYQYEPYYDADIGTGLEDVGAAGAGCWLMHRSVAEAIGRKPYDMYHGGEDLALCRKVQEAGFKTWIDWSIACAHAGVAIV